MTTRRKLAIATWGAPTEGNIYGRLALDTEEVERYLAWHCVVDPSVQVPGSTTCLSVLESAVMRR